MSRFLVLAVICVATCAITPSAYAPMILHSPPPLGGSPPALAGNGSQHVSGFGPLTLNGTTAGNTLLVAVQWCYDGSCSATSGVTVNAPTDTNGNTCTAVPGAAVTGVVHPAAAFRCPHISTAVSVNDTITSNFTGTPSFAQMNVSEWTGLTGTAEKGNGVFDPSSVSSISLSTNGAVTGSNELIWGLANNDVCGYTPSQTDIDGAASYQIGTGPNTYTNTWTCQSGSGNATAIIAGFPSVCGVNCGAPPPPPSTPAQAQAAGFTTQALSADFTVVGGAYSNTATYIDNCGATAALRFYLTDFIGQPSGISCGATTITTDGGTQVLHIQTPGGSYYQLNYPGYWLKSGGSPGFPLEMYVDITFRIASSVLAQNINSSVDIWQQARGVRSDNTFPPNNWYEPDFLEIDNNDPRCPGGNWAGGLIDQGGAGFGPVTCGTDDLSQYHKLAVLMTSDGSTDLWKCTWMDDVFRECIHWPPNSVTFPQHDGSLEITVGNLSVTADVFVKSINIWECASWQTTTCPGTMVTHWPFP